MKKILNYIISFLLISPFIFNTINAFEYDSENLATDILWETLKSLFDNNDDVTYQITFKPNWWKFNWMNIDEEITISVNNKTLLKEDLLPSEPLKEWSDFDWRYLWDKEYIFSWESYLSENIILKAKWDDWAIFLNWMDFNTRLKELAWDNIWTAPSWTYITDQKITKFIRSNRAESNSAIISAEDSPNPIYARYVEEDSNWTGIIYYYSDSKRLYLNSNSSYMFQNFKGLTELDLHLIDSSKLRSLCNMFYQDTNLKYLNIEWWNLKKYNQTTDYWNDSWLNGTKSLNYINMSWLKTPEWTYYTNVSYYITWINVTNRDLSGTQKIWSLFQNKPNLRQIEWLNTWKNTESLTDIQYLFAETTSIDTIDMSNMDLRNITNNWMNSIFLRTNVNKIILDWVILSWLTTFPELPKANIVSMNRIDLSKVKNHQYVFSRARPTELSMEWANLSSMETTSYMFQNLTNLEKLNLSWADFSKSTSSESMFTNCWWLTELDITNIKMDNTKNIAWMFMQLSSLKEIKWIENLNTSGVTNMESTFQWCSNLTWLNINKWDTSKVTNMALLFNWCSSITWLDLSNWDTSKVTNMAWIFWWTSNLKKLNLDNWDFRLSFNTIWQRWNITSNTVETLEASGWKIPNNFWNWISIFWLNNSLININVTNRNIDEINNISNIFTNGNKLKNIEWLNTRNTSNITNMNWSFMNCWSLEGLDLSNRDTSDTTDMSTMFLGCTNLIKLNLSTRDTRKVVNMSAMFQWINAEELDLSSFNTMNLSNTTAMFINNKNLKKIYVWNNFITENIQNSGWMFIGDKLLVWWKWTAYNEEHTDWEYARIDNIPEDPWYFTHILDKPYTITYNLNWWTISWDIKNTYTARESFTITAPTKQWYTFIWWIWSNWASPELDVNIKSWTTWDLSYEAKWDAIIIPTPSAWGGSTITQSKQESKVSEQEHNSADTVKETETTTQESTPNETINQSVEEKIQTISPKSLTRWELAVFSNILLDIFPKLTENKKNVNEVCTEYTDYQEFSNKEQKAVSKLCRLAIMWIHEDDKTPLETFWVHDLSTNEEFIKVVNRMTDKYSKEELKDLKSALSSLEENKEENLSFWTVVDIFKKVKELFN